jgi:hypothetical protein
METTGRCIDALQVAGSGTGETFASLKFAPALAMTAGGKLERAIA